MPRRPVPPAPEFQDRFLVQSEAAALIKISEPALEADRWNGTLGIPYHKFGTRVRYRMSEVLEWAEARRVVPPATPRLPTNVEDEEPPGVLTNSPPRRTRRRCAPALALEGQS